MKKAAPGSGGGLFRKSIGRKAYFAAIRGTGLVELA